MPIRSRDYVPTASPTVITDSVPPAITRLLFERRLTGQLGIGFQGSPGARVFDDVIDTVRQCAAPRAPRQKVMQDAVILWAGLHGIVSLRWSKPGVPWPPVEALARPLA